MSSGEDREDLKRQLRACIESAQTDKEIRDLFQELIATVESGRKTSKRTKAISEPSINPFEIVREVGREGLDKRLGSLGLEELLQIVKYYGLDPSRRSHKWKNPDRVRELIVERVYDKSVQGDVFSQ